MNNVPKKRGCGYRIEGGIYAEVPIGPGGQPVEHFLIDPPKVFDPVAVGITPVGVSVIEIANSYHVMDWVGESYYPNTVDVIEETRRMGLSRRLPSTMDFSLLTPESKIILAHARAHIINFEDYNRTIPCPKELLEHSEVKLEMCAGLWWQDVTGGRELNDEELEFKDMAKIETDRIRVVEIGSCRYYAECAPDGVKPEYLPALFARFPIFNLAVIRAQDGSHKESLEKCQVANLDVHLEDS